MAAIKKTEKQWLYRIYTQNYFDGSSNCILTIKNTKTSEIKSMTLLELANNRNLLSKFSSEDIFMVAYAAAHQQIVQASRWLENQEYNCKIKSNPKQRNHKLTHP